MQSITLVFEWDAGHRVTGHEGKCKNLHGHRYKSEITFVGNLDELGMVIDFGKLKAIIGNWINSNLDHKMILHKDDPMVESILDDETADPACVHLLETNPTAENLAIYLHIKTRQLLSLNGVIGVQVMNVKLFETPNCWADSF